MDESQTSSRVWLITGCSSGFGAALAAALAQATHQQTQLLVLLVLAEAAEVQEMVGQVVLQEQVAQESL